MKKRKAPWPDFKGKDIMDGDTIVHSGGTTAKVVYDTSFKNEWRAVYEDGESYSLCLQVGDKGRAVVVDSFISVESVNFRVYDKKERMFINNEAYPNKGYLPMVSELGKLSIWNDTYCSWVQDISHFSLEIYAELKTT